MSCGCADARSSSSGRGGEISRASRGIDPLFVVPFPARSLSRLGRERPLHAAAVVREAPDRRELAARDEQVARRADRDGRDVVVPRAGEEGALNDVMRRYMTLHDQVGRDVVVPRAGDEVRCMSLYGVAWCCVALHDRDGRDVVVPRGSKGKTTRHTHHALSFSPWYLARATRATRQHDTRHTTHDTRHTTPDTRPTTHDTPRTTHDTRHTTHDTRRTTHDTRRTTHDTHTHTHTHKTTHTHTHTRFLPRRPPSGCCHVTQGAEPQNHRTTRRRR